MVSILCDTCPLEHGKMGPIFNKKCVMEPPQATVVVNCQSQNSSSPQNGHSSRGLLSHLALLVPVGVLKAYWIFTYGVALTSLRAAAAMIIDVLNYMPCPLHR